MGKPTQEDWDKKFKAEKAKENRIHNQKRLKRKNELEKKQKIIIKEDEKRYNIRKHFFETKDYLFILFGTILLFLMILSMNNKIYWILIFPTLFLSSIFYYLHRKNTIETLLQDISDADTELIIESNRIKDSEYSNLVRRFYKAVILIIIPILLHSVIKSDLDIFTHFQAIDYIFLFIVSLSIYLGICQLFFEDENNILFLVILLLVLSIMFYKNNISEGIYKATFTKINNKIIGRGTSEGASFNFDLGKDYIQLEHKQKMLLDTNRSNVYIKVYGNKDISLLITKMGTVKILSKPLKAEINVEY